MCIKTPFPSTSFEQTLAPIQQRLQAYTHNRLDKAIKNCPYDIQVYLKWLLSNNLYNPHIKLKTGRQIKSESLTGVIQTSSITTLVSKNNLRNLPENTNNSQEGPTGTIPISILVSTDNTITVKFCKTINTNNRQQSTNTHNNPRHIMANNFNNYPTHLTKKPLLAHDPFTGQPHRHYQSQAPRILPQRPKFPTGYIPINKIFHHIYKDYIYQSHIYEPAQREFRINRTEIKNDLRLNLEQFTSKFSAYKSRCSTTNTISTTDAQYVKDTQIYVNWFSFAFGFDFNITIKNASSLVNDVTIRPSDCPVPPQETIFIYTTGHNPDYSFYPLPPLQNNNNKNNITTTKKNFKCNYCDKRFPQSRDLKRHLRVHTNEKPYECDQCDKKFRQKSHLTTHLLSIHKKGKPSGFNDGNCQNNPSKNTHTCVVCDKKITGKGNFNQHMKTHNKSFKCKYDKCRGGGKTKEDLAKHYESDHKCTHCNKEMSCKRSLKSHINTIHLKGKRYVCPHCKEPFTQKGNLKKHIRTHTGEKPYKCNDCNKAFSTSSNLTKHIRIHTGEKPYECPHCKKRFAQSSSKNRHIKRLHSEET